MTRRDFVTTAAAAAAAAPSAWSQLSNSAKLDRVGCMTLSFNPVLKNANFPTGCGSEN